MTDDQPCTYCGYQVSKYGRHASSCPTYEIADLEQRLTEFEKRTLELEVQLARAKGLLREIVTQFDVFPTAYELLKLYELLTEVQKFLGMVPNDKE